MTPQEKIIQKAQFIQFSLKNGSTIQEAEKVYKILLEWDK